MIAVNLPLIEVSIIRVYNVNYEIMKFKLKYPLYTQDFTWIKKDIENFKHYYTKLCVVEVLYSRSSLNQAPNSSSIAFVFIAIMAAPD